MIAGYVPKPSAGVCRYCEGPEQGSLTVISCAGCGSRRAACHPSDRIARSSAMIGRIDRDGSPPSPGSSCFSDALDGA